MQGNGNTNRKHREILLPITTVKYLSNKAARGLDLNLKFLKLTMHLSNVFFLLSALNIYSDSVTTCG